MLSAVSGCACLGGFNVVMGKSLGVFRCGERGGLDAVIAIEDSVEEGIGLFALG